MDLTHTHTHIHSLHTLHDVTCYVNGMHGVFCSFIIICCFRRNTNQRSSILKYEYAFNLCCLFRFVCTFISFMFCGNRIKIIILELENYHRHIVTLCSHTYTPTYVENT